jgi:anti-sigma factor RsiW
VTEAWSQADLLAYVDDCLPAAARAAFEARLGGDPALARRAMRWKAQNQAIRAAFGGDNLRARVLDLGRQANENVGGDRHRPTGAMTRRADASPARTIRAGAPTRTPASPDPAPSKAVGSTPLKAAAALALAGFLISASLPTGNSEPVRSLNEAGIAAYRAFAASPRAPLEFAARDPNAVATWLAAQLQRDIPVPASAPAGLTLIGARVAPGGGSSAAFLIYETQNQRRVGLLVQPLDAPAPLGPDFTTINTLTAATWTGSGHGFALVGDLPPATMDRMVESIIASPPI